MYHVYEQMRRDKEREVEGRSHTLVHAAEAVKLRTDSLGMNMSRDFRNGYIVGKIIAGDCVVSRMRALLISCRSRLLEQTEITDRLRLLALPTIRLLAAISISSSSTTSVFGVLKAPCVRS